MLGRNDEGGMCFDVGNALDASICMNVTILGTTNLGVNGSECQLSTTKAQTSKPTRTGLCLFLLGWAVAAELPDTHRHLTGLVWNMFGQVKQEVEGLGDKAGHPVRWSLFLAPFPNA